MKSGIYTGIALEEKVVEFAVARADERGVVLERLPVRPAGDNSPGVAAAERSALRGEVAVGIPAVQALIRLAVFPARDPAELDAMARLDAENYAPLPMDQLQIGVEEAAVLEGATLVWVALTPRTRVEDIGEAFRKAGAPPARLDLNLLGWWELWRDAATAEGPKSGRHLAVRCTAGGADLMALDHGRPLLAAGVRAAGPRELAAEIAERLAALAWEHGVKPIERAEVWCRAADADGWPEGALREALREVTGAAPVEFRRLEEGAIAEGLARRAARGAGLNLAPESWRAERADRRRRRSRILAVAAIALVWALGVGGFYGALRLQRARTEAEKARAESLRGPAEAVLELRERLRAFEGYVSRTHSALEALREITERLPAGVELNSFAYRKHATVALRGAAARPEAVYDFLQALEQSPFFTKIESGEVRSRGGGGKSEFTVTAHLPGREGAKP